MSGIFMVWMNFFKYGKVKRNFIYILYLRTTQNNIQVHQITRSPAYSSSHKKGPQKRAFLVSKICQYVKSSDTKRPPPGDMQARLRGAIFRTKQLPVTDYFLRNPLSLRIFSTFFWGMESFFEISGTESPISK